MVAVPAATPVTSPVLSTEATPGFEDVQGAVGSGEADPVNCTVNPTQIGAFPEIVGSVFTVTTVVS